MTSRRRRPVLRLRRLLGILLALGLLGPGAFSAAPVFAEPADGTVEFTLDQARALAVQAAASGDPVLARRLGEALVSIDPQDRAGQIALAAALPQLGEPAAGREAGIAAWRLSGTDIGRYEAARLTALAAATEGRLTLAQYWLRQAARVAPNETAVAQTAQDFRLVRAQNPLRFSASVSVSPSSNLNGGSDTNLNTIEGVAAVGVLSGDAQALSGLETVLRGDAAYYRSAGDNRRIEVGLNVYHRMATLSDEARDLAPDAENGDFTSQAAEARASFTSATETTRTSTRLSGGLTFYGGEAWTRYAGLGWMHSRRLNDQTGLRFGAHVQRLWDADMAGSVRATSATLEFGGARNLATGARVSGELTWTGTVSERVNTENTALGLSFGFAPAEPVGPAQLTARLFASQTAFPTYTVATIVVPDGRTDTSVGGSLSAFFPGYDWAGFAPLLTLSAEKTDSNVSRFDSSEVSLDIGFRSTF